MYQPKIQNLEIKNVVISLKSVILDQKQSPELYEYAKSNNMQNLKVDIDAQFRMF